MNLNKLFPLQKELDERIMKEKGLEGQDLLDKKILALQVELGELAQNWRGFKFWSEDQEPNVKIIIECTTCNGTGDENYEANLESLMDGGGGVSFKECASCGGDGHSGYSNPLLEEYVDCLHFILSIGNDLGINEFNEYVLVHPERNITDCFLSIFECVSSLDITKDSHDFSFLCRRFIELGISLGFNWKQIEQAYLEKNKINHQRQQNGY